MKKKTRNEIIDYLRNHLKEGIDAETYFYGMIEEGSYRVFGDDITFEIPALYSKTGIPDAVTF